MPSPLFLGDFMKKFKKRFLKFSCILSAVMVLSFTALSPFVSYSSGVAYPEAKIPLSWNKAQTDIYIKTLTNITHDQSPVHGDPLNFDLTGNTWFTQLSQSQRYGSYWEDNDVKFQWFLGRMTYLDISMDTGWDFDPPDLAPGGEYHLYLNYDLDMHNYLQDGRINISTYVWLYNPETKTYISELIKTDDLINGVCLSDYWNSSNKHYEFNMVYQPYTFPNDLFVFECLQVIVEWQTWTSSSQGGYLYFASKGNYLLPYFESASDAPVFPDYSDNTDLNNYNDKVGQADQFVEGNLDNVSNMFASGLSYLTGNFRNTMLYVGSVFTTFTNSKFLSVLVPISLSIGFIAFLLVGSSFLSKSFKSKKGGG